MDGTCVWADLLTGLGYSIRQHESSWKDEASPFTRLPIRPSTPSEVSRPESLVVHSHYTGGL